jgi:hypothetical protein
VTLPRNQERRMFEQVKILCFRLTVFKEGPNKGRQFYRCSQGSSSACNFFQWLDDEAGSSSGQSSRVTTMTRGRGRVRSGGSRGMNSTGSAPTRPRATGSVKRKCGVCGVEGIARAFSIGLTCR